MAFQKGQKVRLGIKHTDEARLKMSDAARNRVGKRASNWRGGKSITSDGYMRVYAPEHPNATNKTVLEHRLVFEKHLGRYLEGHEIVHHINGDKLDNHIDNLELMGRAEHASLHHPGNSQSS